MTKEKMLGVAENKFKEIVEKQRELVDSFVREVQNTNVDSDNKRHYIYSDCVNFVKDYIELEDKKSEAWAVVTALLQID